MAALHKRSKRLAAIPKGSVIRRVEVSKINNIVQTADVFTKEVSESILDIPKDLVDFKEIASKTYIHPFLMYIAEVTLSEEEKETYGRASFKKVYYKKMQLDSKLSTHFANMTRVLGPSDPTSKWNNWPAIEKRLFNAHKKKLKNTNTRTCFKYKEHYYVVAHSFTSGLKTVQPGTRHIYQTEKTSMRIYYLDPRYRKRVIPMERYFEATEQYMFTVRLLEANTAYFVEEGLRYVITAPDSCFFSFHIADSMTKVMFPCKDALTEGGRIVDPSCPIGNYAMMPTPQIEDEDRYEVYEESPPMQPASVYEESPPMAPPTVCEESVTMAPPTVCEESVTMAPTTVCEESVAIEDPVLIEFSSGQEVRMSSLINSPSPVNVERMLMPPPPPPPAPAFVTVEFTQFSAQRKIQVVNPDIATWYSSQFKYREFPNPKPHFETVSGDGQEAMDLTCYPQSNPTGDETSENVEPLEIIQNRTDQAVQANELDVILDSPAPADGVEFMNIVNNLTYVW